jgi:hypothetical protein
MKIISTEFGQVLQLFIPEEIRPMYPHGLLYPPDFYTAVKDRYSFAKFPMDIPAALEGGAKFEIGKIVINGADIAVGSISIYNDGIIVAARDTRHAENILEDFMRWAIAEFGFREPTTKKPRQYNSHVIVEFSANIDNAVRPWRQSAQDTAPRSKTITVGIIQQA